MSRIVIIGSGIAGLTAALRLAGSHEVTLVTKGRLGESNTALAQGGVAGVLSADDSVESHVADTLTAGAGLCDEDAVRVLCTEGPERILELAAAGVAFDRDSDGQWSRGLEGAHSIPRILHAGGDATGRAIIEALTTAVRGAVAAGTVRLLEDTMLVDLVTDSVHRWCGSGAATGGNAQVPGASARVTAARAASARVTGAAVLRNGAREDLEADAVILATGGAGQLFAHTTNPDSATGDGLAAAIRAGATVRDLEFFQFHPTALVGSGFLISEAVRGAGAILLDAEGRRFMSAVDPRGELAPRDVVALAIHRVMTAQGGRPCYLDARFVADVNAHFPSIARGLAAHGLDLAADLVPVTPAAHYFMGGIVTDLDGRTNIEGLFAVGEVARTGVHGANRLASNSLLEGAVFAARAADAILRDEVGCGGDGGDIAADRSAGVSCVVARPAAVDSTSFNSARPCTISRDRLQALTWTHLGVERNETGLRALLDHLGEGAPVDTSSTLLSSGLSERLSSAASMRTMAAELSAEFIETANLALIARTMAEQALAREESRGAHTRTDFPRTSALYTDSATSLLQEASSC